MKGERKDLTFLFFIRLNFKKTIAFKRVMIKYEIMHILGVFEHEMLETTIWQYPVF